ncbi:hypothetical protein V2J09_020287 [Rumex salicifolius]
MSFSDNVVKHNLNHPGSIQWQDDPGVALTLATFNSFPHSSSSPFSLNLLRNLASESMEMSMRWVGAETDENRASFFAADRRFSFSINPSVG